MKELQVFFAILALGLGSACLPKDSAPVMRGQALRVDPSGVEPLRGLKIKELFVVVFPKDFTVDAWKEIFIETNELSHNKRRLREVEGRDEPQIQEERANLIGRNAEILSNLGKKSLFMMSWSTQDENCRIAKDSLKITCKPFNTDNPLNGGMPVTPEPVEFVIPDPVQFEVKTPFLKIVLERQDQADTKGPRFKLTLRLKPEEISEDHRWYKGDVTIGEGSTFPDPNGGDPVANHYPYGYAELSL